MYEYRYRDNSLWLRDVQSPDAEWALTFENRQVDRPISGAEKQPTLEKKLEPFHGRWATSREGKSTAKRVDMRWSWNSKAAR